jgi:hypothetical protein
MAGGWSHLKALSSQVADSGFSKYLQGLLEFSEIVILQIREKMESFPRVVSGIK